MKWTYEDELRWRELQREADEREAADMTPEQRARFWRQKAQR